MKTVRIQIDGQDIAFDLDFGSKRWSAKNAPAEGYFPLVVDVDDKRYELYSDETFAEVDL